MTMKFLVCLRNPPTESTPSMYCNPLSQAGVGGWAWGIKTTIIWEYTAHFNQLRFSRIIIQAEELTGVNKTDDVGWGSRDGKEQALWRRISIRRGDMWLCIHAKTILGVCRERVRSPACPESREQGAGCRTDLEIPGGRVPINYFLLIRSVWIIYEWEDTCK